MTGVRDAGAGFKGGDVKIPFRMRLKAWWEGQELHVRQKQKPVSKAPATPLDEEPPFERWSEPHLEFLQAIWGEGFITPGGPDYLLQLVKPVGLTPAMSLLEIGSGIGGHVRLMANTFGVWAAGVEREPRLAEVGAALSTKAGLERKASIERFDTQQFKPKKNGYDCVFAKESFFTIENKEELFEAIKHSLKDTGHLVFTDYVLGGDDRQSRAVQRWADSEPISPHLWTVELYEQVLKGLNFDLRIVEDVSADYQRMVTEAWTTYLSSQKGKAVDKRLAPLLVEEVEHWTRRMQVLASGGLRVCRIYALKKSIGKLMSDW